MMIQMQFQIAYMTLICNIFKIGMVRLFLPWLQWTLWVFPRDPKCIAGILHTNDHQNPPLLPFLTILPLFSFLPEHGLSSDGIYAGSNFPNTFRQFASILNHH